MDEKTLNKLRIYKDKLENLSENVILQNKEILGIPRAYAIGQESAYKKSLEVLELFFPEIR